MAPVSLTDRSFFFKFTAGYFPINMTVLIIEDEELAALELKSMLMEAVPGVEILAILETVSSAVSWFRQHQADLVFMDIHLGDGESFDIFRQVGISSPVVFTTAYDQYTLKAFKHQGVDYLLKPFDLQDVRQAIKKVENLRQGVPVQHGPPRTRFMVKTGTRLKAVQAAEIAYFMADDKYLFLVTREGQGYIIEETITSLEPQLSSADFFRINRKFIIHISSIKEMFKVSRNRVRVILDPEPENHVQVLVTEERAEAFKAWLNM